MLKTFTNDHLGEIDVILIDNKPYFDGTKVAKMCSTLCDNGTLFAYWAVASLRLEFFNQDALDMAIEHLKLVAVLGPMNMESFDE